MVVVLLLLHAAWGDHWSVTCILTPLAAPFGTILLPPGGGQGRHPPGAGGSPPSHSYSDTVTCCTLRSLTPRAAMTQIMTPALLP